MCKQLYKNAEMDYILDGYKTARQEKRSWIEKKDKELLALERERNELYKINRLPVEYTEVKPIRDGWSRTFDLREDLKGRPDYKYLKEILDKCNIQQFCRNKHFSYKARRGWMFRIDRDFKLKSVYDKEFLKFSERAQKEFWKEEKISWSGAIYNIWHPAIPAWMMIIKIKPHYIRYFASFDTEVESKLDRINNRFNSHNLYPRLNKLHGCGNHWDEWDLSFDKKRLENKQAKTEMEEAEVEFFS